MEYKMVDYQYLLADKFQAINLNQNPFTTPNINPRTPPVYPPAYVSYNQPVIIPIDKPVVAPQYNNLYNLPQIPRIKVIN